MLLIFGTLIYLPMLYLFFELPKVIINDALKPNTGSFPREILGTSFNQIEFLLLLCAGLLVLMLLTAGTRYYLSVYKGVLSEVMLRRLRYDLYTQVLRFPLEHFRRVTAGEIVTMTTAEVEPLGRYMGVAVANPVLQGGTLITALTFLFVQDPILGLAAIALFPVQVFLVPKLQQRMNVESRKRLRNVRLFSGHISESIAGVREIHSHDTSNFERARTASQLGTLFRIRRTLYILGNGIIFLNTFFTQLTPVLFYSIGGYLVIMDELSLGALIAVIAAYRETVQPWNELLENYQQLEDNRVKYDNLIENFLPDGLRALPDLEEAAPESKPASQLTGPLKVADLSLRDGETRILDGVSLEASLPGMLAVLGPSGSGKSELAQILCGLRTPSGGGAQFGETPLTALDEPAIGRCLGYVDPDSHIFSGSWRDNLLYGLKHRPVDMQDASEAEQTVWVTEAIAAGNSPVDPAAEWIDYASLGVDGAEDLTAEAIRVIRMVGLENDLFIRAVQQLIDPRRHPALAEKLLEARRRFRARLDASEFADAVEFFDPARYNANATLSENLLFGRHTDETFDVYHLGVQPFVLEVLREHGLLDRLVDIGRQAAAENIEMFRNLAAGDERLERFSLIRRDEMPGFEILLRRIERNGIATLRRRERCKLLSLAFMLAPAHQRLGLIDDEVQAAVVRARRTLHDDLPAPLREKVEFFAEDAVSGGVTVQCNLMYGRLAKTQHRAEVNALMQAVIDDVGIRDDLLAVGLGADVGAGGSRLSPAQRQKMALARCLIKRPEILIVNEAINALDTEEQERILTRVVDEFAGRSVIWVDREQCRRDCFDKIATMRAGKVVDLCDGDAAVVETPDAAAAPGEDTLTEEMRVLLDVPLLQGLDPSTVKLLAYAADRQEFAAGETVFREGDTGDSAAFVLRGAAEACVGGGEDGSPRRILGSIGPGGVIGEITLLLDSPRAATVIATEPLSVLMLSRELFLDLIRKDQQLGLSVMRDLAGRLSDLTKRIDAGAAG